MTETTQQRTERLQAAQEQRKRDSMMRVTKEAVREMLIMVRELHAHMKAQQGAKK